MLLPLLLLPSLLAPGPEEVEVTWNGRPVAVTELPAELGPGPEAAATAWARWSEARGYRMFLDPTGRVLLVSSAGRRTVDHQLQLIEKTVTLFDELLPVPRDREAEVVAAGSAGEAGAGDDDPDELPEDPDGPPSGWAPTGLAELPWSHEWGDDTVPLDTETCVLFVVNGERDYFNLLDTLGEKQDYLKAWLPTGKEYTGFVLERPLCGAYIEGAEGMEEWNPDNEVVNRVAQMLFTRRFSQQPYWLVQGMAWQLEYRLLKGIYCFPYRRGFVFAVEHTSWENDLQNAFRTRQRQPLSIREFAEQRRGEYEPMVARLSFGILGLLFDFHRDTLSDFVEALRLDRKENERVDRGDGTWYRSLTYQTPLKRQVELIEKYFGLSFFDDAGEYFRRGKRYKAKK